MTFMQTNKPNLNPQEPQALGVLLESNTLGQIVAKARLINKADQFLAHLLPKELTSHCRIVNYHENTLVLAAANAAWGTRLRFLSATLLPQLRKELSPHLINSLHIIIRPISDYFSPKI